jgi:hypothetical protein
MASYTPIGVESCFTTKPDSVVEVMDTMDSFKFFLKMAFIVFNGLEDPPIGKKVAIFCRYNEKIYEK